MQQHSRFQWMRNLLLFPANIFKWAAIHLVVHETSCFRISLDPETGFRIQDLATLSDCTIAVAVSGWRISCHILWALRVLLSGFVRTRPRPSGLTSDWAIRGLGYDCPFNSSSLRLRAFSQPSLCIMRIKSRSWRFNMSIRDI